MFKKLLIGSIALMMVVSLAGCNFGKKDEDSSSKDDSKSSSSVADDDSKEDKDSSKDDKAAKEDSSSADSTAEEMTLTLDGEYFVSSDKDFRFKAPAKDWKVMNPNGIVMVVAADYPTTTDNINVITSEPDPKFDSYDKAYFEKYFAGMIDSSEGSVTLDSFDKITVSDHDAYKVTCTTLYGGKSMKQTQIYINGEDKIYMFTFTDVSGAQTATFEQCIKSIELM